MTLDLKTPKDKRPLDERTGFSVAKKPPQDIKESETQIQEVSARFARQEIKLTEDQEQQLKRELEVIIDGWKDSRSGLKRKLKEWNNALEGVVTITDFPWVGASHIHVPMPKIKSREIRSTINRSTMRPVPFLMTKYAGPDTMREQNTSLANDLEGFVEDKIKNSTNVHRTLKDALTPIFRDGTCPIQITWETDWERVFDYKTYSDLNDFVTDYPSADDAGLSADQYDKVLDKLIDGKSHEIKFEYDVATYDGPKAHLVPLIDFVHYPVYVPEIEDTICHGKRIWLTDYQVVDMFNQNKFRNKEQVQELVTMGGDFHADDYTTSRDSIEGINRTADRKFDKEFEFFELIYKTSLTKEDKEKGIKRKYLIYYYRRENKIFRIESYPIRKGRPVYFILRYIPRDNRLLGMSLIDDILDLSNEVDIIHRQRINSRTITHVPTFKGKSAAKDRFDPGNRSMRFQPGRVFWLRNEEDVVQFDIKPTDLSGTTNEELLLFQLIDMVTGSSSGLSGQSNPIDPRAPARKEQQQLRQSTNRIDDYVESLVDTFTKIGQHFVELYYQFGPDRLKFYVNDKDGNIIEKEIDRAKLFNPNVLFTVNGTSVFVNPEQQFARDLEVYGILAQDPITAENPRIRRNSLGRLLASSRIPDEKSLLPTDEEIQLNEQGKIPSEAQREEESKSALTKQKAADRIAEAKERGQIQKETELIRQVGNIDNASLRTPTGGAANAT